MRSQTKLAGSGSIPAATASSTNPILLLGALRKIAAKISREAESQPWSSIYSTVMNDRVERSGTISSKDKWRRVRILRPPREALLRRSDTLATLLISVRDLAEGAGMIREWINGRAVSSLGVLGLVESVVIEDGGLRGREESRVAMRVAVGVAGGLTVLAGREAAGRGENVSRM